MKNTKTKPENKYVFAMFHTDFTGITIIRPERKKGAGILPCPELASDERHIKIF
ncbi:MAG: hypothetical protein K5776_06870 [Lachnospiraceae bacterium]|nr:hypothetical protein [Lachnospiraceae bacterium]